MKYLDFEKANILQKQFTSVFTEQPPGEVIGLRSEKIIQPLIISPEAVLKKLDSLGTNKSVGLQHKNLPKDIPIARFIHSNVALDLAWKDNPLKYNLI